MDPLDEIVKDIDQFPTLPDVAVQVSSKLSDENASLDQIAEMISLDQSLASRIIQLANSPLFASSRPAESLKPAIFRLGCREVGVVITTVAVMQAVPPLPPPYDLRTFWTLALASAMVSRKLAHDFRYPDPEEAYLAGLVHLMGEVYLAVQFTERFERAIKTASGDGLPFSAALTEEFGRDQAEVGARLLTQWNFPIPILEAVRFQFTPDRSEAEPLLAGILFAADHICRDVGLGLTDPAYIAGDWMEKLPMVLEERVERDGHDFQEYVSHTKEQMSAIEEFARSVFSGR